LANEELKALKEELNSINSTLKNKEHTYNSLLKLIDSSGKVLSNIKNSISIYDEKVRTITGLRAAFDDFDKATKKDSTLKVDKARLLVELNDEINNEVVDNFETTVLDIHESLMGSREASFGIRFNTEKSKAQQAVNLFQIYLRADSDGSYSVNREKVFIYDVALMVNEYTRERHPRFLVHDNLFHDDDNTLARSLNYLENLEDTGYNFQYIITLNRERIDSESENLKLDLDSHIRAQYTKANRFLRKKYSEL
jgi:hypothetical protein